MIEQKIADPIELSDDQLDAVSGGFNLNLASGLVAATTDATTATGIGNGAAFSGTGLASASGQNFRLT
jgi:hypothetical protein